MKRKLALLLSTVLLTTSVLTGCGGSEAVSEQTEVSTEEAAEVVDEETEAEAEVTSLTLMEEINGSLAMNKVDDAYRNVYEIFVYSFCDSNGDGIGDLKGITSKLDYLNDGDDTTENDLGIDTIWLTPVMPSTTYHKYDVIDYYDIDEQYGTLEDFQNLIKECDARGIDIIMDLVMNHSSSKHMWFEEATAYLKSLPAGTAPNAADCPYVDYYHFTTEKGSGYNQVAGTEWYYECPFWSEMPDLNLQSDAVRAEFDKITDYWLAMGVAGFRLDAVGEYESGSIDMSIEELKAFVDNVKSEHPDCYLVGEIWKDMSSYTRFYESGIDSCFDFAFADSTGVIANTVKKANGYTAISYGKAQENIQSTIKAINENALDAPFYTNHDIARSAGFYAGDFAPNQTKIAHAMNLFMSGNTYLYYGEELGMKGSGKDENKRAPMQWTTDKSAEGFCAGPPNMGSIKMKYPSLEVQKEDGNSIYNYVKQIFKLKAAYPEIARGTVTFEESHSNENVCVMRKEYNGSSILIVYNISETQQSVSLEGVSLSDGKTPEIGGVLLTGNETTQLSDGTLTMPAYSVVLLK